MANSPGRRTLRLFGIPEIESLDDFSDYTHLSKYAIYQYSAHAEFHYRVFFLDKKCGGKRRICQPSQQLKGLQSWILREILDKLKTSQNCKGFELGANLRDNAEPHVGSSVVMTIDLADFFPSVPAKRVFGLFRSVGFNARVAALLTRICTFENGLPQGAPTSPKLANLVLWVLDRRIQGYVGRRGITYTRYADDMTFSANNPQKLLRALPTIHKIIQNEGFQLNDGKTRIAGPARAKRITGLTVTEISVGVGTHIYRRLRARLDHLTRPENVNNEELLSETMGWLAYLKAVDPARYKKVQSYILRLNKRNRSAPISFIKAALTKSKSN